MWWVKNSSGAEHLLAVSGWIFVGLEERDAETADKCGGKVRIARHCKKPFQKREAGCLHGREQPHPFFFLYLKQFKPAVELVLGDRETFTEALHGKQTQEILRQDPEDEEEAIGRIRDDKVREDGMGMTAGTDKAQDTEAVADRFPSHEINQGAVIISMDGAGAFHSAARAGLQFRTETDHEGVKKVF